MEMSYQEMLRMHSYLYQNQRRYKDILRDLTGLGLLEIHSSVPQRQEKPYHAINVRLPTQMRKDFLEVTAKKAQSPSRLIRQYIEEYLKNNKNEEANKND